MAKNIIIILFFLPIMCFGQQEKDLKKKFKSLFKLEKTNDIRWIAQNKEDMYFENDTLVFYRYKTPEDKKIVMWSFASARYFYQGTGGYSNGSFFMSSFARPKNLAYKLKIINEKENIYLKIFYDNKLETVYKLQNIEFIEHKDYKVTLVRQN
ncbi:hypothetical protein MG290_05005 [Flavobacterium sp. CBA20B-1]|uniref:hypothetical protein n=1 Tax=unclassified Flavobacterium TaxID=196869 RepID=UPI0022245E51|nr:MULTISPECIES: hypothetical protein [unclassified Flavobacterium]WCM43033.1 hypothetical protein MG290_05005 [Flavobacterium sp. CBA20B-1]